MLVYLFERHAPGTGIATFGDSVFWSSTQFLTVSSQLPNPITTPARVLDVFLQAYAIADSGCGQLVAQCVLRSPRVARSLHVRLDTSSEAALNVVRAGGMTDSEAVRTALREAAARRRTRSAIRAEVRRVATDESDREEMRIIREQMADLAPPARD